MSSHDYTERRNDADTYMSQWDVFWSLKYPEYKILRKLEKETDKVGIDLLLQKSNNRRMLIDEKISYWEGENFPIETMSNSELGKIGWAYTNKDFVAFVHVAAGRFRDEPILFKCDSEKFKTRIINNPLFDNFTTQTPTRGTPYTSRGKAVPREWLINFENDAWFDIKTGNDKQTKLWYY